MATKSYKVRLDLRYDHSIVDPERFKERADEIATVQRLLDDTREAFNVGVDYLAGWLLRMHRGAGVCREKKDGIWREWEKIDTIEKLQKARQCHADNPGSFALLENRELLNAFEGKVKSEAQAVELAECCRRIAKEICPTSDDGSRAQMPRDDFDLLTNKESTAKNLRGCGNSKSGAAKRVSGRRPGWRLGKAVVEVAERADSLDSLVRALSSREEFDSAKKDGVKKIERLQREYKQMEWSRAQSQILEKEKLRIGELVAASTSLDNLCNRLVSATFLAPGNGQKLEMKWRKLFGKTTWEDASTKLREEYRRRWEIDKDKAVSKLRESEASGSIAAYQRLLEAGCLPLPGFASFENGTRNITLGAITLRNVESEWKRSMWNMAGQRVRSHLGWVRRRANERLVWELLTTLFKRGGWIRAKSGGRTIKRESLTPADIRFDRPSENEAADFEHRPGYGDRKWVQTLTEYESVEMPKHLEGVALGAAEQPRIRRRTAKGWARVREKWIGLIEKANPVPSASDLIGTLNLERARKPREFGDQRLFEWLATSERRWLWDGSDKMDDNDCGRQDRDCVSAFVDHNEHLADKPKSITFTRSDSVQHPVWPYFGENSAIEYHLSQEKIPNGRARLVLVLKELLSRQDDGSYTAVDGVKIALRGYEDFEDSFAFPDGVAKVSARQKLLFRDDLLGGGTREGTLSGMKLTWERDELEAHGREQKPKMLPPRVYANFSCDAGKADLPEWLTKHVGADVKLRKPRDGMTRVFFLKKTIGKESGAEDSVVRLAPGNRRWPKEAIDHGFTIRGTDLGYRTSSAGAWWRLSRTTPKDEVTWPVGKCGASDVYAVLERTATVSLPGDGEVLPPDELALRERLFALRTRLNLDNALLRAVRLLTLESVVTRTKAGEKTRKRSDGTTKRVGTLWKTETKKLADDEIKDNCRKAAELLVRWAATDAMSESLKGIGREATLWAWLTAKESRLEKLGKTLPTTEVPTEKEAKESRMDRESLKTKRQNEDDAFVTAVHELRVPLAKALCDGYDAQKGIRGKSGLWSEFDAALVHELSYGVRKDMKGHRTLFGDGLFRLLRKPPVTKHNDRKDEANNLPHGNTYRGGLSMARLNFLDDVKNFVRRWSCRPRWPGDVRRVPEDAKFDRCDTEHLDHLREHRAKLIAHADVAQTLGFGQDLRRGLWRFKDKTSGKHLWHRPERGHFYREDGGRLVQCPPPNGVAETEARHPHPAFDPAHVLVYEDLTRYKMTSDRPKNENAGLARWSHRRILGFAQHIGGLFGVPVATVDARFSSRYCSHCGAPGCRAVRFDPGWLNQRWMQKILQSNDIRDAAMKGVARQVREELARNHQAFVREGDRPWVLRDGGTHFVCASPKCRPHAEPIHADENAAANIGLRFVRGVDGIRVTINASGKVTKSVGYVPPETVLVQDGQSASGSHPFWKVQMSAKTTVRSRNITASREGDAEAGAADKNDDEAGGGRYLFRDPSGGFRDSAHWVEGKIFWAKVAISCATGIKAANASRFGSGDDD